MGFLGRKHKSVFGLPLNVVLERTSQNIWGIPLFFQLLLDYVEKEGATSPGIFQDDPRTVPNKSRLKEIKKLLEKHTPAVLTSRDLTPYEAAFVIKQFLGELPECLLTVESYRKWYALPASMGMVELKSLVDSMPRVNRVILHYFLRCILHLASSSQQSKLTIQKAAVIFAPIILRQQATVEDSNKATRAIQGLLLNFADVFTDLPEQYTQHWQKAEERRTPVGVPSASPERHSRSAVPGPSVDRSPAPENSSPERRTSTKTSEHLVGESPSSVVTATPIRKRSMLDRLMAAEKEGSLASPSSEVKGKSADPAAVPNAGDHIEAPSRVLAEKPKDMDVSFPASSSATVGSSCESRQSVGERAAISTSSAVASSQQPKEPVGSSALSEGTGLAPSQVPGPMPSQRTPMKRRLLDKLLEDESSPEPASKGKDMLDGEPPPTEDIPAEVVDRTSSVKFPSGPSTAEVPVVQSIDENVESSVSALSSAAMDRPQQSDTIESTSETPRAALAEEGPSLTGSIQRSPPHREAVNLGSGVDAPTPTADEVEGRSEDVATIAAGAPSRTGVELLDHLESELSEFEQYAQDSTINTRRLSRDFAALNVSSASTQPSTVPQAPRSSFRSKSTKLAEDISAIDEELRKEEEALAALATTTKPVPQSRHSRRLSFGGSVQAGNRLYADAMRRQEKSRRSSFGGRPSSAPVRDRPGAEKPRTVTVDLMQFAKQPTPVSKKPLLRSTPVKSTPPVRKHIPRGPPSDRKRPPSASRADTTKPPPSMQTDVVESSRGAATSTKPTKKTGGLSVNPAWSKKPKNLHEELFGSSLSNPFADSAQADKLDEPSKSTGMRPEQKDRRKAKTADTAGSTANRASETPISKRTNQLKMSFSTFSKLKAGGSDIKEAMKDTEHETPKKSPDSKEPRKASTLRKPARSSARAETSVQPRSASKRGPNTVDFSQFMQTLKPKNGGDEEATDVETGKQTSGQDVLMTGGSSEELPPPPRVDDDDDGTNTNVVAIENTQSAVSDERLEPASPKDVNAPKAGQESDSGASQAEPTGASLSTVDRDAEKENKGVSRQPPSTPKSVSVTSSAISSPHPPSKPKPAHVPSRPLSRGNSRTALLRSRRYRSRSTARVNGAEVGKRLYDDGLERKKRLDSQRKEAEAERKRAEENDPECTFRPSISSFAKKLPTDAPVVSRIFRRHNAEKAAWKEYVAVVDEIRMQDCTFKPGVSDKSSSLARSRRNSFGSADNLHESLYLESFSQPKQHHRRHSSCIPHPNETRRLSEQEQEAFLDRMEAWTEGREQALTQLQRLASTTDLTTGKPLFDPATAIGKEPMASSGAVHVTERLHNERGILDMSRVELQDTHLKATVQDVPAISGASKVLAQGARKKIWEPIFLSFCGAGRSTLRREDALVLSGSECATGASTGGTGSLSRCPQELQLVAVKALASLESLFPDDDAYSLEQFLGAANTAFMVEKKVAPCPTSVRKKVEPKPDSDDEECCFAPRLNSESRRMARGRSGVAQGEDFLYRLLNERDTWSRRANDMMERQIEKETRDCTFTPAISKEHRRKTDAILSKEVHVQFENFDADTVYVEE